MLIESFNLWFSDLKETALKNYFDMVELYLMAAKDNRAEFSLYLLEKVIKYIRALTYIVGFGLY